MAPPRLSLRDVAAFDPYAKGNGTERRFACPLCGHDKPRDAAHRCLSANTDTGKYSCFRCHSAGVLLEFQADTADKACQTAKKRGVISERPKYPTDVLRSDLRARKALSVANGKGDGKWHQHLAGVRSLDGTLGAEYLTRRGIEWELAYLSGVRYSADWLGKPAVVFPVRDAAGKLVAAQGRYVAADAKPKCRTVGEPKLGVFASVTAWECDPIILVEAPIDALSLHTAGYPAIAALGCNLAAWVPEALALRQVLVATDADAAGDRAAAEWAAALSAYGARVMRLRTPDGQDWNDLARQGAEVLSARLDKLLVDTSRTSE